MMNENIKDNAIDAAISTIASKFTYGSAGASIIGWLASSEATVLISITIAVASFFVNWYYKHKQHQREQAEHDQRMGLYE